MGGFKKEMGGVRSIQHDTDEHTNKELVSLHEDTNAKVDAKQKDVDVKNGQQCGPGCQLCLNCENLHT